MPLKSCQIVTLFSDKWQAPCEYVHEVGQPVGMRTAVELADVHHVVLVFQNGSLERETNYFRTGRC